MKKEVFEKLNQNDRIEYLLLEQKKGHPPGMGSEFLMLVLIAVMVLLQVDTLVYSMDGDKDELRENLTHTIKIFGWGIILYLIIFAIGWIIDAWFSNKLDKKFLEKLDIKAKGDKPK